MAPSPRVPNFCLWKQMVQWVIRPITSAGLTCWLEGALHAEGSSVLVGLCFHVVVLTCVIFDARRRRKQPHHLCVTGRGTCRELGPILAEPQRLQPGTGLQKPTGSLCSVSILHSGKAVASASNVFPLLSSHPRSSELLIIIFTAQLTIPSYIFCP